MSKLTSLASHLFATLQEQLAVDHQPPLPVLRRAEAALGHCRDALDALRQALSDHPFAGPEEEIHFFKTVKPPFMTELLYYTKIYQLHESAAAEDAWPLHEQLGKALWQVHRFFEEYQDFYTYWHTGRTDLDTQYFIHGRRNMWMLLPGIYYDPADPFFTGYDLLVACIQAYDRWESYLAGKAGKMAYNQKSRQASAQSAIPTLPWTGPKTALTEILYGFESTGVIGHGKIPLKQIAEAFQSFFAIDLGNYSDSLMAFRARKTSPTLFLDEMKEALLEKLDEEEK